MELGQTFMCIVIELCSIVEYSIVVLQKKEGDKRGSVAIVR